MTQIKQLKEIVENTVDKAIYELNNKLRSEYWFKLHNVFIEEKGYEIDVEMELSYSVKLMEISEVVSERLSEYVSEIGVELSEEEIDKLWEELYENTLSELNNMYMYNVNAEIRYNLSDIYPFRSGELIVSIKPLLCRGDYCDVGSYIRVMFYNIRREAVETTTDRFAEFLVDLLRLIYDIITL